VHNEIVDRAKRGDEEAFDALARQVGDRCMAIASRILRDVDLAEDAVQAALIVAWRELRTLRDSDRFEPWLHRIPPDLNPGELDPSDVGAGPSLVAWQLSGTFVDPCTNLTLVKPTPGPGIDALADALAHQPGTTAGPPTAVTVGGYRGKVVELTVTADITKCDRFTIWASPDGNSRFVQGTSEMNRVYILDVGGRRFTFSVRIPARTTAADRTELQAVIDSIGIEP